ncbi:Uncharacterised protein g7509 [Pycnogonum litorale]
MGNACSTGPCDRKGSDAYNPCNQDPPKAPSGSKPSKSSWKKLSKSKDKNESFTDVSSQDQHQSSASLSESSPAASSNVAEHVVKLEHSKLECKVSEDTSTTSLPIPRLEVSHKPSVKGETVFDKYDEEIQTLLLWKNVLHQILIQSRKIILYVCYNCDDSSHEQLLLKKEVYPYLRQICCEKNFELFIVDLHSTNSAYTVDQYYAQMCVNEITESSRNYHVVPVILLNNTAGTVLLPDQIAEVHFSNVLNTIDDDGEKLLLNTWYFLDKNIDPPCYRLHSINSTLPNNSSLAVMNRDEILEFWNGIVVKLKHIVIKYFVNELKDLYLKTAMEEEIQAIFEDPAAAKFCSCFTRWADSTVIAEKTNGVTSKSDAVNLRRGMQSKLKTKLDSSQLIRLCSVVSENSVEELQMIQDQRYIDEFIAQMTNRLKTVIQNIITDEESSYMKYTELGRWFGCELRNQFTVCGKNARKFLRCEDSLERIKLYVQNEESEPLIVHGPPGCGKTYLLSKAAEMCKEWLPDAVTIYRTVGISLESSTMEQVAMSICHQCSLLCPVQLRMGPMTFVDRSAVLPHLFSKVCKSTPLVIIIDGLDHIPHFSSSSFLWLPSELCPRIKVIISLSDNSFQLNRIKEVIVNTDRYFRVPTVCVTEATSVFRDEMSIHERTLTEEQNLFVTNALDNCRYPLYINMLAFEARKWTSNQVPSRVLIGNNIVSQINCSFDNIELIYGKEIITIILGYLTCSKYGLMESEIHDLLVQSKHLKSLIESSKSNEITSPTLLWVHVKERISNLLTTFDFHGVPLITWRSREARNVAVNRYLNDDAYCTSLRRAIVEYFDNSPSDNKCIKERSCCELPYQEYYISGDITSKYIFNKDWLMKKLAMCDAHQVLEDVNLCLPSSESDQSRNDLLLIKEFLELSFDALSRNGNQLFAQLYGRLHYFFNQNEENCVNYPLMKKLYDLSLSPPISTLLPLNKTLRVVHYASDIMNFLQASSEDSSSFTSLFRILNHPHHMISISTNKGEVIVWNITTQRAVRTLTGITQPRDVQMIDDYRAIILCNRELKIYNLDEGLLLLKVKGVMNQSMPYYGLHNHDHVVAMSRNRMYVNMMNIVSGDLVTTFKVGEDRFLNSLIVSKNGKVCVCGDQTQKPSPLLVWDLTSRKLMYDLRIPHHEFVTKFAAITDDGNYVVCVSKEVDNRTTNNVVVYDLQSGTLFKKWKPVSNTSSISISSIGNCVITGLEDTTLVIWDLITGACRATLRGHTSPVTNILLSEESTRFATFDDTNKDRSIHLWDSSMTTVIATFTPDAAVISCQIDNKGNNIVLGLAGATTIVTLSLCGESVLEESHDEVSYGDPANNFKTFDLSRAEM